MVIKTRDNVVQERPHINKRKETLLGGNEKLPKSHDKTFNFLLSIKDENGAIIIIR